jgi:hypothetical protein
MCPRVYSLFCQVEKDVNQSDLAKQSVSLHEVRCGALFAGNMDAGNAVAWGTVFGQDDEPRVALCRCGMLLVVGGEGEAVAILQQQLSSSIKKTKRRRGVCVYVSKCVPSLLLRLTLVLETVWFFGVAGLCCLGMNHALIVTLLS